MLSVAVIGAGRHAQRIVYPAMIAAGYQILAVATRHMETAQRAGRKFGGGAAFDNVERMLQKLGSEIEAVVVVLPPDGYEEAVMTCLRFGLPVYCEKPVAMNSDTLHRLERERAKERKTVMVGYMKRFAPAYERAQGFVQAPHFGGATAYNAYWGMGPAAPTLEFLMLESAVHHLDLARFIMGEVKDLAAWAHEPEKSSIGIGLLLRFESGAVGTLQVNTNSSWDHDNEWISVTGRGPVVLVDNVETCTYRVPGDGERRWVPNYTVPIPRTSSLTVTGFTGALTHFAEVVRRGIPCRSDLASAVKTTELAERVISAVRSAS